MTRVLHGYFRSSAAYRVRIALNLKGLDYEPVSVHLRKGEQRAEGFLALNPQGMVPALVDGEAVLTQSPAILEYLDEAYPGTPRLLPGPPVDRARVRALAAAVGCSQDAMIAWYNHWIAEGFRALERMLADDPRTGRFCHGDAPGLADVCLVPQVANSQRPALDLTPYPTIRRIAEACDALEAFQAAHPSRQPDAE